MAENGAGGGWGGAKLGRDDGSSGRPASVRRPSHPSRGSDYLAMISAVACVPASELTGPDAADSILCIVRLRVFHGNNKVTRDRGAHTQARGGSGGSRSGAGGRRPRSAGGAGAGGVSSFDIVLHLATAAAFRQEVGGSALPMGHTRSAVAGLRRAGGLAGDGRWVVAAEG
jgi:hypothetical protein